MYSYEYSFETKHIEKLKKMKKEFLKNDVPPAVSLSNHFVKQNISITEPEDDTILSFKHQPLTIARYHKNIDKWVLEPDISPDIIPEIAGKQAISFQQYILMKIFANYILFHSDELKETSNIIASKYKASGNNFSINQIIDIEKTTAEKNYNRLPQSTKDILSTNIKNIASNKANTLEEVMCCLFENMLRTKELEVDLLPETD